jgi:sulfur relay (sulfurtransferase) DsrC/TusE family protein
MIPDDQTMEMKKTGESWTATIPLSATAKRIDFFSNHRKTLTYNKNAYRTYMSSPYTRIILAKQ